MEARKTQMDTARHPPNFPQSGRGMGGQPTTPGLLFAHPAGAVRKTEQNTRWQAKWCLHTQTYMGARRHDYTHKIQTHPLPPDLLHMTNRSNTKAWSGQFEVSSEVKSIVRIYKEVAKPDAKVLKVEDKICVCVGWKYCSGCTYHWWCVLLPMCLCRERARRLGWSNEKF